ncbi:MAG: hypothetical protein K0A90_09740 [Methanosarcinaceae archaeon]|nr:hypothetical protein [Methanosarcinaceae archaeon]
MVRRKGMDKAITIFAAIVLALIVAAVMVSFVSGFFSKTKGGQETTFEPGESAVSLAYKQSVCQSECVELCFQGQENPKCSVDFGVFYTPGIKTCTCSW